MMQNEDRMKEMHLRAGRICDRSAHIAFEGVPEDVKFYIKANATNCKKIVRMIKKSGFGKVDYTKNSEQSCWQ